MPRASDILPHGIPYEAKNRALPDKIDWRESGYVTGVKDQGNCFLLGFLNNRAVEGQCRYNRQFVVANMTGYYTVHSGSEIGLKNLVGAEGPAAVAVDVESDFMMYRSGIYQSQTCSPLGLNHAVLAVGYGTQDGTSTFADTLTIEIREHSETLLVIVAGNFIL
nr:unnamed protein product [Fasciola hepatica]